MPGDLLTSKPTWSNAFGRSTTSAFLFAVSETAICEGSRNEQSRSNDGTANRAGGHRPREGADGQPAAPVRNRRARGRHRRNYTARGVVARPESARPQPGGGRADPGVPPASVRVLLAGAAPGHQG